MMAVSVDKNGQISLSWSGRDAWEVGYVLHRYGVEHSDAGFREDGLALMEAADEWERRKGERDAER